MDFLERIFSKQYPGIRKYYRNHPELHGRFETPFYTLGLPDADQYSGYLKGSQNPHLYVIDNLQLGSHTYNGVHVLDAHGHVEDGVWMVQHKKYTEGKVDIRDLVKAAISNGHTVDLLLICSEYAPGGTIREPSSDYYDALTKAGVAYVKPFERVVPDLHITKNGYLEGKVKGYREAAEQSFLHLEQLNKRLASARSTFK